jgi:hypothetical protein
MIVIKEKLDIYFDDVILFIGSHDEVETYIEKDYKVKNSLNQNPYVTAESFEIVSNGGDLYVNVIYMPFFNFSIDDYDSLVHECVHAGFKVCKRHDLPVSAENNENLAYIASHLFSRFLTKLKKKLDYKS